MQLHRPSNRRNPRRRFFPARIGTRRLCPKFVPARPLHAVELTPAAAVAARAAQGLLASPSRRGIIRDGHRPALVGEQSRGDRGTSRQRSRRKGGGDAKPLVGVSQSRDRPRTSTRAADPASLLGGDSASAAAPSRQVMLPRTNETREITRRPRSRGRPRGAWEPHAGVAARPGPPSSGPGRTVRFFPAGRTALDPRRATI